MTDQQKVQEAFEAWYGKGITRDDAGEYDGHTYTCWRAWQAALAHASSATVKENLTVGEGELEATAVGWVSQSSLDAMKRDKANVANLYAFKPSPRNRKSDHVPVYLHPSPSAEDARDAGGWREMDSAPIDKAIMGAWFGSSEYTEVSPVIYCSERDKWMNPSDMRDDEYTKPDMWHPYPSAPKHRDVDQALAAERGEA